jgi:hypothetical protein
MMVVPMMNHFLEQEIRPNAPAVLIDKLDSFNLLADVVHLYKLAKKPQLAKSISPTFHRKCEEHFRAFLKAYPDVDITWKRHATLQIGDQIEADGMLMDAFACERKHCGIKTAVHNEKSKCVFERSTLIKAIRMQLFTLSSANTFANHLVDELVCRDGCRAGKGVVFQYAKFHAKDFIQNGCRGGLMQYAILVASEFAVVVEEWTLCNEGKHRTTTWQRGRAALTVWPLGEAAIRTPSFWYEHGDGLLVVVE